jgi:membrane-bound inhibitor of C-type lysozyme
MTMMRIGAAMALAALTAGLAPPATAQSFVNYECDGGSQFELALFPDIKAAFLQLDGKSVRLPQFVSLSGTRYRKDGITIWIKGDRATLRRAGKRIECAAR